MKAVGRYRHEDGRLIDLFEVDDNEYTLTQIYPEREELDSGVSREAADGKLEELGFGPANQGFTAPCPCPERKPCEMSLDTGLYYCTECERSF